MGEVYVGMAVQKVYRQAPTYVYVATANAVGMRNMCVSPT